MTFYFAIFAIAVVYYFLAQGMNAQRSSVMLACFLLMLALVVGFADMAGGYDRYIYCEVFDSIADATHGDKNYARLYYLKQGNEWGYFYWQIFVSLFTKNRYIFILVTTLLMYVLYFKALKDYVDDYPFACILFLGMFFFFTMTYLRQVLACGFCWNAVKYVWQRKPIPFFLLVLLAYSFHGSAAAFAPMYFVPIRKYPKPAIIGVLVACALLGFTPLPTMLMASSSDRAGNYDKEIIGFRYEYILEAGYFAWLFFANYDLFDEKNKRVMTFVNMGFLFCCILLLFMRFGQGGRIGWYYFMGLFVTVTYAASHKLSRPWMKPLTMVVSFLLFTRIVFAWGGEGYIYPYKTFMTNGPAIGKKDFIKQYEYNSSYANNKFCR